MNRNKISDSYCPKNEESMADLKMNEFTTVSSVSKVVGVDDNGNNRLISPNDLINIGNNNGGISDLNNALKTGFYVANFETGNMPVNDYGLVEVIYKNPYIIQKYYALNRYGVYFRKSINNGSLFSDWVQIK